MKKMKQTTRILAIALSIIMLIQPNAVVYASVGNTVAISYGDSYASYEAYTSASYAADNPIRIYVEPEDFPICATITSDGGSSKDYEITEYGTTQLEVSNFSAGKAALSLLSFFLLAPFFVDNCTYATIIVAQPKKTSSNANADADSDLGLQPLLDKMDFGAYSDELFQEHYGKDIEEYMAGTWDGSLRTNFNEVFDGLISSTRRISYRQYSWRGISSFGNEYNDIDVNIDYIGSLDVKTSELFTLAINYSNGAIEKWEFLEMTDSWKISLENESIESVIPVLNPTTDECQADVFTVDKEGNQHLYLLMPNGEVLKAS